MDYPGRMPRKSILSAVVVLVACVSSPAQGQLDRAKVDEIVVTAQKREQRFIEVPINLTALSGDFLQDLGYYDYAQIGTLVPGLTVQAQSPNNPGYNIRGITSDSGSAQFEPRVSLYENGVPTSRSRGSYAEVFDAERVEVLKGPQSTLFGRSAEIGAISVVTNKPTDELDARIRLGGGNLGYFLADGFVNVPIGENMSTRLALIHRQRNGFLDNLAGGELNGLGVTAIRGSMRFWATDDLTIDLILGYQHDDVPARASSRRTSRRSARPPRRSPRQTSSRARISASTEICTARSCRGSGARTTNGASVRARRGGNSTRPSSSTATAVPPLPSSSVSWRRASNSTRRSARTSRPSRPH